MMLLMGFFSLIVLFLGKIGKKTVWKKKADFTFKMFKKSLFMLVPFVMIVMGLKQQGHRMKVIMEVLKEDSVVDKSSGFTVFDGKGNIETPKLEDFPPPRFEDKPSFEEFTPRFDKNAPKF